MSGCWRGGGGWRRCHRRSTLVEHNIFSNLDSLQPDPSNLPCPQADELRLQHTVDAQAEIDSLLEQLAKSQAALNAAGLRASTVTADNQRLEREADSLSRELDKLKDDLSSPMMGAGANQMAAERERAQASDYI